MYDLTDTISFKAQELSEKICDIAKETMQNVGSDGRIAILCGKRAFANILALNRGFMSVDTGGPKYFGDGIVGRFYGIDVIIDWFGKVDDDYIGVIKMDEPAHRFENDEMFSKRYLCEPFKSNENISILDNDRMFSKRYLCKPFKSDDDISISDEEFLSLLHGG